MVAKGPIEVDCHNQLIGHLPTCSRSGGHTLDLADDNHSVGAEQSHPTLVCSRTQKLQQHIGVDTMPSCSVLERNWMSTDLLYGGAGITPGFFCCHRDSWEIPANALADIDVVAALQETMGSTPSVSVRKQGREELMAKKPRMGGARLPGPVATLCKTAYGDPIPSLLQLYYWLHRACIVTLSAYRGLTPRWLAADNQSVGLNGDIPRRCAQGRKNFSSTQELTRGYHVSPFGRY